MYGGLSASPVSIRMWRSWALRNPTPTPARDACRDIIKSADLEVTHASLDALLADADFDIVALADVYSLRGAQAISGLEWLTGHSIAEVIAARAWDRQLPEVPFFQDAAQAMFRMSSGAGVIMDASYTAALGHKGPWVLHFNGTEGNLNPDTSGAVILRPKNAPERILKDDSPLEGDFISDLVAEIEGSDRPRALTTKDCLRASRISLLAQHAAGAGKTNVLV